VLEGIHDSEEGEEESEIVKELEKEEEIKSE
jgi:hypothetical protein